MTPGEMLEQAGWDTFWVPSDVTVTDRPDLLQLSCPRGTLYLNSVLRTRAAPEALPALIAEAETRFSGRRARWCVPDTVDPRPLEAALEAAGWDAASDYEVRAVAVASWTRPSLLEVRAVDSMARLLDCYAVSDAAFGRVVAWTDEEREKDLWQCTEGGRVHRFVAYDGGRPVASGGLTAFPALGFGLLWAGGTLPDARGRGAYLSVLAARIERARALGLTTVGLNAKADTSGPIVARLGFGHFGRMTTWERSVP
ncbi:MAG: GNAT family N-acetyltransferase [Myxococcota bacterium]